MTKDVQDLMTAVERRRDAFHAALFADTDPEAAAQMLAADAEVSIDPGGARCVGPDAVRGLVADTLVLPADLAFRRVSRTGDRWRVVDEDVVTFTHDRELPWLLPGVGATHRAVEVDVVTIVAVRRSQITRYRALWDRCTLLAQLGVAP